MADDVGLESLQTSDHGGFRGRLHDEALVLPPSVEEAMYLGKLMHQQDTPPKETKINQKKKIMI